MECPFFCKATLQCRLRLITDLISPLHASKQARKNHPIQEKLRSKWQTISLPLTTFTACMSMGLSNSHLATSFSPIDCFRMFLVSRLPSLTDCVVTKQVLHHSPTLYFRSNPIVFLSIAGFSNEDSHRE